MKSAANWLHRDDLLLIVLASGIVALYVALAGPGFPLDDSWIHQTYARTLAQHGEWAFIPGVPSAASTSPLYTVLLAIGYALRVDYPLWTHLLGGAALALCGIFASRMGERLTDSRRLGLVTGAAVILTWQLVWAAASGMETALFAALTLALTVAAWRELDTRSQTPRHAALRGAAFGIVAALAVSTRPEGILLAGLLGLGVLATGGRAALAWCGGAAVGFLLAIAPYLALNLHLTGGLLPNTSAAKQAEYAPVYAFKSVPTIMLEFFGAIIVGGQAALLPGIVAFAVTHLRRVGSDRRRLLLLVPLAWAVGLIVLYAVRLPMTSQHGRYVIPALPSLVVIGVAGTVLLIRALPQTPISRVLVRVVGLTAVVLMAAFALLIGPMTLRNEVRLINEEMVTAAHWLRDNLPPENGLLALHDIGAVGYFAPRDIIDTAGLVTPEIVPIIHDADALWAFLEARGAVYFLGLPDQIPGQNRADPRLCEVYTTGGTASLAAGGGNMTLYRLAWDSVCGE